MVEVVFFLSAFLSEIIGTIAGFGSSTIFLPLALFFVDFKTALVLVAVFHIFGNIGRFIFFRKNLNKKIILMFGIPSVLLTVVGAFLVSQFSTNLFKLILGIFLIIFSLISLLKPNFKIPTKKQNAVIGGIFSGFFAGLIGTGGALRGAFLTAFNLKKYSYISTSAVIALLVDITRLPIYFGSGFLNQKFYHYIPILFVLALSGSFVGKKFVNIIPQNIFRKFVLTAIMLISIKFIFDSLSL